MSSIPASTLLAAQNFRYATKKFDPAYNIPADALQALRESLRLTASSFGLQPWKFIEVDNKQLREALQAASWHQTQITQASKLFVFARPDKFGPAEIAHFIAATAKVRSIPVDSLVGYQQTMEGFLGAMDQTALDFWMEKQSYIALGNLLTSAALLGLDACPIEGISRPDYDRILGLPERGLRALVVCAVGRRAEDDKYASLAKVRYAEEEVFLTL